MVEKLDRLSRSLKEVLTRMVQIQRAWAGFKRLTEAIDTTTSAGILRLLSGSKKTAATPLPGPCG